MPAIPNVIRRGATYHWRRRLPATFGESAGSVMLVLGLRTRDPSRARFLAGQVTALADLFLSEARTMRLTPEQTRRIFAQVFTAHLDKLEVIAARERGEPDFNLEQERLADIAMGWVYRLLETRGEGASVDERAASQMEATGMDGTAISDVAVTLDLMRRNKLVPDRRTSLQALVEDQGGAPSPMNLLIAQSLIYQARSAACFQVARRHDGVRVEDDALLAQVLQARLNRNPGVDDPDPQGKAPPDVPAPAPESAAAPQLSDGTSDAERLQTSEPQAPAVMPDPAPHFLVVLGETLITKKSKSKDDAKAWDAKTSKQARQTYRLFAKLLSEKGIFKIEQLEQGHFAGLTDFFDGVAKSYGKFQHDEKRSTTELREIGKRKPEDQRGLSAETINRHVSFLQAWVENARARGTGLDRQIDVSLLRQRTYGRGREKRGFFELDYLDAVFSLPFFTGCRGWQNKDALETGDMVFHRTLFFAPIMFHYIIARREEICGLLVKDVQDTSVGAVRSAVIWIRWTEQRRVKSPSSKRCIPVHDELIRLGFLEYVDCICSLGYSLVFPDLKSPTSQSPLGDRLYDEFIPGLHKAIPDALALKQVIQSFRRTGGDALKRRNVHSERRSDILGHAGKTITEETYADNLSVEEMRVELAKLPVVTTHLKARPINLLPWVAAKQPAPFSRASRKRERPMK